MSSDKQEASPDQQRKAIQDGTAKQDRLIVREYFDDGISGDKTEKRRDFLRMLRDATEKGDFREIWCWDQDRFGRFDSIEAGFYVHPLRAAGVKLVTIADGPVDWDDFTGRIMFSLKAEAKHQFLRDLSRNVTRGMKAAAEHGQLLYPCYGYLVADGTYVPNPDTAPVVKRIFRLYVKKNLSLRAIAKLLNTEGIPSPSGSKWDGDAIRCILRRRKYIGTYTWAITRQGSYHAATAEGIISRHKGQSHERSDGITIADHHEALVAVETFEAAAGKLADNQKRTSPFSTGSPYLLTGLLYCAECGARMNGTAKPGDHRHYICSAYAMRGKAVCNHNRVEEAGLVQAIVGKLRTDYLSPRALETLKAELQRQIEAEQAPADPKETDRLRKQITGLDRRIDQGAERILTAPATLADTLYRTVEGWQSERRELQARLDALEARTEARGGLDQTIDQAIEALWTLREAFSKASPVDQGALLQQAVSRIDCHFSHHPRGTLTGSEFTKAVITPRWDLESSGLSDGVGSTL